MYGRIVLRSNKNSIIYKILHTINILIVIASIVVILISNKTYLFPIVLLYCFSFDLVIKFEQSLCIQILTIYMQLAGPIQMLIAEVSPISVFGPGLLYLRRNLIESEYLHWQYFVLSISFYFLLLVLYWVINSFFNSITIVNTSAKGIDIRFDDILPSNVFIKLSIVLAYALFEYYLRITFDLNVPGRNPTIAFAGVIVYLISFIHQLLGYMLLGNFYKRNIISVTSVVTLIIDYAILSIPDLLLDRRSPIFFLIIIAFLHMYFEKHDDFVVFLKKNRIFIIALIVLGLLFFEKFSEHIRYMGQVDLPIIFFLSRITGLADGFVVLDYYNQVGPDSFSVFTIPQYFHNVLINGSRSSMCYVYTHTILGFPTTAIHSNSLPIFTGSLMYSNIWGFIFMAMIFSIIFCWADRMIDCNKSRDRHSRISLYIGCYLSIYSVALLMGGGAERLIEIFTLPIMFSVLNVVSKN